MTDLQTTAGGLPATPSKLDVGGVARTSWRVFRRQAFRYVWLLIIPILIVVPFSLLQLFVSRGRNAEVAVAILALVSAVIQYGSQFICQLAILYGAHRNMEGASFKTGEAMKAGARRLIPYVGLIILVLIILSIGFLLLFVPALIAGVFLAPSGAACMIERRGPIRSIQRSIALVQGNWWRTFGALLLATLVPLMGVFGASFIIYLLLDTLKVPLLALILILPGFVALLCVGAVAMIVPAVIFVELRSAKEGRPVSGLADVFT